MPASTFSIFDEFGSELGKATHNLTTTTGDVFKIYLTNSAVTKATNTVKGDHTPITTNGGEEKTVTHAWAETGAGTGIWRFTIGADQTWTATGAGFTFRYAVLYNSSKSDKLVGFWDYGSAQAVAASETFTLDVDANFAAFTLTV